MGHRPTPRQVAVSLLRTAFTVVSMVAVYYLAPLGPVGQMRIGLWLLVALAGLGAALTWQIHAVTVSTTPRLRATETIAVGLPLLLLLFAEVYLLLSYDAPASFTQPLNRTGALYFTMTVFATVGFGDIAPLTDQARVITMTQMLAGLIAVGLVARALVSAVQRAVARESDAREPDHGGDEQPRT
ncbi:Ion channel [Pseudonocardia ammonioxydans]|uniref:Ion channel n=1 Tax=Pseudonocardia ammonioxydans TaxID=260086 RepID=A0A1I4X3X6_PSUAM|nr:Ion channel [Pseudonocardia ammonioxydans]